MQTTFAQVLIAALAIGAVSAAPQLQPRYPYGYGSPTGGAGPISTGTPGGQDASKLPKAKPAPVDLVANGALLKELSAESTANGRFKKLLVDANGDLLKDQQLVDKTVFDFKQAAKPNPGAKGGALAGADVASFPILKDLDIATTVGFLDACGMNTAHVHPRATELLTVVDGELETGMILQNGLLEPGKGTGEIKTHLSPFQATVFPQGSIHYQFNPTCKPTTFIAHLNAEDPGTNQIAQGFFNLDGDVVAATLGFPEKFISGQDVEQFRSQIPANVALSIEQCLKNCGLGKNQY